MSNELACYILKNDHELKCELKDVRAGDHFRLENETGWSVATKDAAQDTKGIWFVMIYDAGMEKAGPVEIPLEDTMEPPTDTLSIKVTRRDGSTDVIKS